MTKAVMMSIQPKWVEKILNGEKTIEVRKTAPLSLIGESVVLDYNGEVYYDTPFKVYIYCTKGMGNLFVRKIQNNGRNISVFDNNSIYIEGDTWTMDNGVMYTSNYLLNGKVVAEFTCDKVSIVLSKHREYELFLDGCCLSNEEIDNYSKGKDLYGWHISNLKIYDKPRELGEFYSAKQCKDWDKRMDDCVGHGLDYQDKCKHCCGGHTPLTKPPQSWCYVEEVEY